MQYKDLHKLTVKKIIPAHILTIDNQPSTWQYINGVTCE
ncbi:hypothetical protein SALWKB12_0491 [Snodgrassella communis]|nr:hypothetical protein SALWKB12_0491 [Snodgrassella communis]